MREDMIRIDKINKYFGKLHVLKNVTLNVRQNEVVSIIGASGSGKSTLLRCINGLEKIQSGEIYVNGLPMSKKGRAQDIMRRHIGMVFQNFNLFPHYTVLENVMNPMIIVNKINPDAAKKKGVELLAKVKLEDKLKSFPSQLSGGQKQRVAIARALAMEPEIMLFDEPTSALDPELVGEVQEAIKTLAIEGMTMAIVSHEMRFVKDISHRVIFMDQGEIFEEGTGNELFENPQKDRTKEFLSKII